MPGTHVLPYLIKGDFADSRSLSRCIFLLSRYGLGTCYLRMSKIRLAEYHYRKAVEIHPNNAVLLGCVGMVSCIYLLRPFLMLCYGIMLNRMFAGC